MCVTLYHHLQCYWMAGRVLLDMQFLCSVSFQLCLGLATDKVAGAEIVVALLIQLTSSLLLFSALSFSLHSMPIHSVWVSVIVVGAEGEQISHGFGGEGKGRHGAEREEHCFSVLLLCANVLEYFAGGKALGQCEVCKCLESSKTSEVSLDS